VGIVPFFAVGNIPGSLMKNLKGQDKPKNFPLKSDFLTHHQKNKKKRFNKRTKWFLENRPDLAKEISFLELGERCPFSKESLYLLAIPKKDKIERVMKVSKLFFAFLRSPVQVVNLNIFSLFCAVFVRRERVPLGLWHSFSVQNPRNAAVQIEPPRRRAQS
jgi:hypothetical protein